MKINIVSTDKRYFLLNSFLNDLGYDSKLCNCDNCQKCDVLILSVRNEYTKDELNRIFDGLGSKTLVLCGEYVSVSSRVNNRVVVYSRDEQFIKKNARLTAEGAITLLHNLLNESLCDKKILVSGYGRIGKELCRLLIASKAQVYAYARRNEVISEMEKEGVSYLPLDRAGECDIIVNTVPSNIFNDQIISSIPKETCLVELASSPYGFSNMERVYLASGIPGKILTVSAARAVLDTVVNILSTIGKDNI